MMNQEPEKAKRGRPKGAPSKRYKRNKPKRILSAAEKKIFDKQKSDVTGRFNQITGKPKSTYDRSGLDTSRLVKDLKPKKGEVIDEERYKRSPKLKKYDDFLDDARNASTPEKKLNYVRKATDEHNKVKKLSPKDIE